MYIYINIYIYIYINIYIYICMYVYTHKHKLQGGETAPAMATRASKRASSCRRPAPTLRSS